MKFIPGPAFSAASGSQGGTVFSHNRYGAYTRSRVIPVNPNTAAQQAAHADFAAQSTAWGDRTESEQRAWFTWAANNPITDSLGQQQILAGNAAFIQINTRLARADAATLTAPPVASAPDALLTLTLTGDIGAGNFGIVFTPTPLDASLHIWARAAVVNSDGINYVTNLLRQVTISGGAQVSPLDNQTDIEDSFGALAVAQVVHQFVSVFDSVTGLLSVPRRARVVVTST